jgi:hypothetical protein
LCLYPERSFFISSVFLSRVKKGTYFSESVSYSKKCEDFSRPRLRKKQSR